MEADREQPAGEVLFTHPARPETAGIGGGELAASIGRHLARGPAVGDLGRGLGGQPAYSRKPPVNPGGGKSVYTTEWNAVVRPGWRRWPVIQASAEARISTPWCGCTGRASSDSSWPLCATGRPRKI